MGLLSRLIARKSALRTTLKAKSTSGEADSAATMIALANRHFLAGELDAARDLLERALQLDPYNAPALNMLGGITAADGDIDAAMKLVRRAIAVQPSNGKFHLSLGRLLGSQKHFDEAVASYRAATRLEPNLREWRLELEALLVEAGQMDEAASAYSSSGLPDARAYFDLGDALLASGRPKEAEKVFMQSTILAPESGGVYMYLAIARQSQGRPGDAEAPARRATEVAPDMPQGWFVLGTVLAKQTKHVEAVAHYRRAISLLPDYQAAWDCLLFSMHYCDEFSPREVFEAHLTWGKLFPEVPPLPVWPGHLAPGHRLRVGYLSADYFQHPVAHFLEPLLKAHNRARFEVFCYHVGASEDAMTARLKSYPENWRRLQGISDDDLEKVLRHDQIDVLVELSGHTEGHRLPLLARRVAPIQVTYLGYPNTTGLGTIDYRITDARADPPGESDALHVETLVRLPETFLCYSPPTGGPDIRTPPSRRDGHITFGSFNNFVKVSATTVALWARILAAVPGSKILIKARWLQDPSLRALLAARFQEAGIEDSRLRIIGPNPGHHAHMQVYDQVDIALDTFPYHGTTTTLEALWMNVPVITLAGHQHASRVGVSILSSLGLSELIARTQEDYIAIATDLAGDPHRLDTYARSLRARLQASPLTDGPRFTRHLEKAYLQMWAAAGALDRAA